MIKKSVCFCQFSKIVLQQKNVNKTIFFILNKALTNHPSCFHFCNRLNFQKFPTFHIEKLCSSFYKLFISEYKTTKKKQCVYLKGLYRLAYFGIFHREGGLKVIQTRFSLVGDKSLWSGGCREPFL